MLIDTHAHLQMKDYDDDRDEVIARAAEADIEYIINASFDLPSSQRAVELARAHNQSELADQYEARLRLYQARQAYRQSAP